LNTRVLTLAIEEIADAALWFDSQAPGLGNEFWQLVDRSLAAIEENPHRFAKSEFAASDIDLRFAYVRRFQYVIHFAIEPKEILIVAITHAARKPGYWLSRIRQT